MPLIFSIVATQNHATVLQVSLESRRQIPKAATERGSDQGITFSLTYMTWAFYFSVRVRIR